MSPQQAPTSLIAAVSVQPDPTLTDTFTSVSLWRPCGARGVFGGQVIAQSLLAASHTITPPLGLHSQHCYFLLPADASRPITYEVERLRDGKSYASRLVRAKQGKVVFVLIASWALPPKEGGIKGDPPFSFIPTTSASGPTREPALSHSLRFAVERTPSNGDNSWGEEREKGKGKSDARWRESGGTVIPPFTPRFEIPIPADVMSWEECEEEEVRWERFLHKMGDWYTGRPRKAVEE